MPETKCKKRILITILSSLITVAIMSNSSFAAKKKSNVKEIILVYKSHFDIGYTHLASVTIFNYRTKTIDGALDVADKNKN